MVGLRRFSVFLIPLCVCFVLWAFLCVVMSGELLLDCKGQFVWGNFLSAAFMMASACIVVRCFEGNLISAHFDYYAKPEMAGYLRTLSKMRIRQYKLFRLHRTPFNSTPYAMGTSLSLHINQSEEEETARRALKFYFIKALDLYKSGRISYASFIRLVDQSAISLFFDVVEPIEASLDPIYEATLFHQIMLVAGDVYLKHKLFDAAVTIERILEASQKSNGSSTGKGGSSGSSS